MKARLLLVLLIAACVSCSDGTPPPPKQKASDNPPEQSAVEVPEASSFLSEVTKSDYPELQEKPEGKILVRLDFSGGGITNYAMEQISLMSGMGPAMNMKMNATLSITSKEGNRADVVVKDIELKMDGENQPADAPKPQPMYMMDMNEDGSGEWDSSQTAMIKILFPIPPEEIGLGETAEVPIQMPFNAGGSVFPVKGQSKITLTRFVEVGGRKCAQLDVEIDMSKLQLPSELEGKHQCFAKGLSRLYFDYENRVFVAGTFANLMSVKSSTEVGGMTFVNDSIMRLFIK